MLAAASLLNGIPEKRLQKLLQRVLAALPTGERPFNAEEEEALAAAFENTPEQITLLTQAVSFIFETVIQDGGSHYN